MTALKEYARLESSGLWRPDPDAQRREVGLSFGEATLVISDAANRPLGHWSLPAIERLNPGAEPALYSPDADATETLEIADDLMVDAIEQVRRSLVRARPKPSRLRNAALAAVGLGTLALAVFWLPGALTRQTLSVVPPAKRSEIGATLLGHLQRVTGASCRDPLGSEALLRLKIRVLGRDAPGQILVMPGGFDDPLYLPGGIILLTRAMVEGAEEPAVVAGWILASALGRASTDPLEPVLAAAGLPTTLRLLTTGDIPTDTLRGYVTDLIAADLPQAGPEVLLQGFEQAEVPIAPWAQAAADGSDGMQTLIEGDRMADRTPPPILTDGDWIALQGICTG